MTDSARDDWASLSDEWRVGTPVAPPEELRRRVRRRTARLYLTLLVEVALTIAAAILIGSAIVEARSWDGRLVPIVLALFSARIWMFTLSNRRGLWRAQGETLEAFRALQQLRDVRRVAAARFTWRISLALLPVLVTLMGFRAVRHGFTALDTLIAVAGVLYLIVAAALGRVLERRLGPALQRGDGDS